MITSGALAVAATVIGVLLRSLVGRVRDVEGSMKEMEHNRTKYIERFIALEARTGAMDERLERIERKLDRLLERGRGEDAT